MPRKRVCATTIRLYQTDSHLIEFDARILDLQVKSGKNRLELSETAFYPTSGGQPHDEGTIAGLDVLDVYEEAETVIHVVDGILEHSQEVSCEVNWVRRHDHMQQHTGQHILSQALIQVCDIPTVGFTIGPDWSTIVLDRKPDPGSLDEALALANSIVDDNRPVDVLLPSPTEITGLPVRGGLPDKEIIRIVRIDGFDWSPCGGTHCKSTGDVRLIVVLGIRKEKETYRLEFVCGRRAETAALHYANEVSEIAAMLEAGSSEIVERTRSLLDKVQMQEKTINELREARLVSDFERLLSSTSEGDEGTIGAVLCGRRVQELRQLAHMVVEEPGRVAILVGTEDEKVGLAFARSDDRPEQMNQIMRAVCESTGCRGGGNPAFASGGGAGVDPERVLEAAKQALGLE